MHQHPIDAMRLARPASDIGLHTLQADKTWQRQAGDRAKCRVGCLLRGYNGRTQTKGNYENAKPIKEAIELVNKLYDEGYRITLYTSSFMGRSKSDQREAYEVGYEFNKKQLQDMGVKYHELFMGKPPTDALVDDQAVFFNPDWDLIEKEIRSKLNDTNK